MLYTNCTVTINGENSIIDKPVVLYRGDKEVEIKFYIMQNTFYQSIVTRTTNVVSDVDASFSQLVIRVPEREPIFSSVTPVEADGAIIFKFTAEMIDEVQEVGAYDFQIRLLDENKTSRATIPPVTEGIKIKEPIAIENESIITNDSNEVNVAQVNEAIVTTATPLPAFDEQGNYIETTWTDKMLITDAKLNKIEDAITGVNQKADSVKTLIPTKTSQLENDSDYATITQVNQAIDNAQLGSGEVDLSGYVTKGVGNANQITFADGQTFQAKLDNGTLKGEKGDKGADGLTTSISLNGVTYTQENGVITLPNITSGGNIPSVTQIEPQELDMPKVFFYGNALPTTKDNVLLTMDYISNTDKFSSFVKLKCQGTSSMTYAKKNFTVAMYSDEARVTKLKKDFKGWGAQSKFCLKANYVDTTHTRNISGARIGYDMVASRPDSAFKQQLLQCPRNGLVDGFPIKLYFNGEFYGIYTWNIPKDGWMFNMDSGNPNHIVLCAEKNTDGNSSAINSCQFRQLWDGGGDWSYEFGTPSNTVKDSLNRCIGFVMNATDQEFHDNIGQYFDLYSLLDYYCFSYLACHLDGLAKNMLMVTYDGVIWGACLYDMDSIYGVQYTGNSYVATNYQCPEQYQEQFSRLWVRIEQCFATELYTRYLELRQGALSLSNIVKHVEEIYDIIPDRVFADEKAKWTSLPNVNTNTMTRFRNYMRDRAVYVDAQMREIGTKVPCTGIVLSADTLSFTTTDTQTLSVVVSPENCTEEVAWSVSPTGVVSVNNGVVTPIKNGTCTITATCGSYSDTCAVTVSGMSESGGDTDIYATAEYAITEPRTFNGTSDYIDTGIQLFDTSKNATVFIDLEATSSSSNGVCLNCMEGGPPWHGLSLQQQENYYRLCGAGNTDGNYINNPALNATTDVRQKMIITITNGVPTTIDILSENSRVTHSLVSTEFKQLIDRTLTLGAEILTNGTKRRYWNGTINKFAVWFKQLTENEINQVFGISGGDTPSTNANLVFQVDSTSMNTTDNTLTDNIAGISATLTGNPTVSNNQIAFDVDDTFSFDISSLNLTNSNRTVRIKFTPTSLDNTNKNVIVVGSSTNAWNTVTSCYIKSGNLVLQHGSNSFTNVTTGSENGGHGSNRLPSTPVTGQEYELVISENTDGNVRWFIDGTLVQNGTTTLFNPLYITNIEGANRFIGSYSLIEIYDGYCNDYTEFTNMVNNA